MMIEGTAESGVVLKALLSLSLSLFLFLSLSLPLSLSSLPQHRYTCSPWDTFTDGDESATPPSPPTISDNQDSNDGEGSDE